MQKEVHHIPWISVTFVLLAIATVGFFTSSPSGVTGALVYRDYGYGGYGGSYGGSSYYGGGFGYGLSITEFYDQYHLYIDAVIFLLIFLSIGKAVFLSHFNTGGKSLYIAIGIALTLGLMLWEEQSGISVISRLGVYGILVLMLTLFVGTYKGLFLATGQKPVLSRLAGAGAVLLLYFILIKLFPELNIFDSPELQSFFQPTLEIFKGWFSIISLIILAVVAFTALLRTRNRAP